MSTTRFPEPGVYTQIGHVHQPKKSFHEVEKADWNRWMRFKRVARASVIAFLMIFSSPVLADAQSRARDEAEIKAMMESTVQAYTRRDLDQVLALYRNDELMFFDLVPPMKDCCGYEGAYRKTKSFFDGTVGPILAEWSEISIAADSNLAFATAFLHFAFTTKDGKKGDVQGRSTLVFRKLDGKWTCIHQHDSVPTTVVFSW